MDEEIIHTEAKHEEMRSDSEHLLYEIIQARDKAEILAYLKLKLQEEPIDECLIHSVFESFLIHSRLLYEFLFKGGGSSKITASGLIGSPGYKAPGNKFLSIWAWDMASERLFHLTKERKRITAGYHQWKINRILAGLWDQLAAFYDEVPDEHLCDGLRAEKKETIRARNEGCPALLPCEVIIDTSDSKLTFA